MQDYEVRIDGEELTDDQIARLREATRLGGCLTFTNAANALRFHRAQARDGRDLLKAQAVELLPKLVGLPRFNPSETTLAEFAVELEAYCGFDPGTALQARDNKTLMVSLRPKVSFDRFRRLSDAIIAALAHNDEVTVAIVSRSS